jgi:REP element-mobilizing transposase RayT
MPNHVHLLTIPMGEWKLEDILGSIKKFASRRIGEWAEGSGIADQLPERSLWQQESYDRIVRDAEELAAYRKYIALNPIKAQLRDGEFIHHSAAWLDEWMTPRL